MNQYNSLNENLSNSQLNKLKSEIKSEIVIILRLSSNMIGSSNDENNFLHKLLLTNRHDTDLRKPFTIYLSTDIKLSKTWLSKMIQSGGFLVRLLGSLLKAGLSIMKIMIKPLPKIAFIQLGLTAAAAAADAGIQKNILRYETTTLIISKGEMEDIMKISQSFWIIIKKSSWMKQKNEKEDFCSMLLGILGASLLGIMLLGKARAGR